MDHVFIKSDVYLSDVQYIHSTQEQHNWHYTHTYTYKIMYHTHSYVHVTHTQNMYAHIIPTTQNVECTSTLIHTTKLDQHILSQNIFNDM